jgi:hypothetical protein
MKNASIFTSEPSDAEKPHAKLSGAVVSGVEFLDELRLRLRLSIMKRGKVRKGPT